MIILAIGDICGESGMRAACGLIRPLKRSYGADLCVANGENADVTGIRPEQAQALYDAGADVVTLGNHAFRRRQIIPAIEDNGWLIRPANYSPRVPGRGCSILTTGTGRRLCVVNLLGRLGCEWNADNPFTVMENILSEKKADLYVVDLHAEATSEKNAFARHFDGRVSVVFGTHTHVQTSDECLLPRGTGFITDLGMTGAIDSVLGIKAEQSVNLFLGDLSVRLETPPGPARLEGAVFEVDEKTGLCVKAERIRIAETEGRRL